MSQMLLCAASKETQTPETNLELDMGENGIGKTNFSDIVRDVSADMVGMENMITMGLQRR